MQTRHTTLQLLQASEGLGSDARSWFMEKGKMGPSYDRHILKIKYHYSQENI